MSNLAKYYKLGVASLESRSATQDCIHVAVIAGPSMEGLVARLAADLPGVVVRHVVNQSVSQESQQMDEAQRKAMVAGIQDQLTDFAKEHPTTGPVHVYLLDGKGLSSGAEKDEATLAALAASAMNDQTKTVAAFMPEDTEVEPVAPGGQPKVIEDVVHEFIDNTDAASVEGYDALLAHLKSLSDRSTG